MLAGVGGADRERAETVLRSQGFGEGLSSRKVGSLLMLLNFAGLIRYSKPAIEVLRSPSKTERLPPSVFVAPDRLFGNRVWLRRTLEECEGYIRWFDKHFTPAGLEIIWEAVDGERVSLVRILSLAMPDNTSKPTRKRYQALVRELAAKGVEFEWRVIDSRQVRDTHDRWLIGADSARNVPNLNAILSGQHSELNESGQHDELLKLFEGYWDLGTPLDETAGG
jgi:hypothetical protein